MIPNTRRTLRGVVLSELETFMVVAELGSFRAAAAHLNLAQSSVSSRIQRLEAALHTQLLVRTTRAVEVTTDGTLLLVEAHRALDSLSALVNSFFVRAGQARQQVSVAATPMVAAIFLPTLIRDYCARFTDVDVRLLDLRHTAIFDALESGDANMAIFAVDHPDERFLIEPIGSEEVVLFVPDVHPLFGVGHVGLDKLAGERLITLSQYQSMIEIIISEVKARDLALPRVTTVHDVTTLTGMFDAGHGIALMSRAVTKRRHAPEGAVIHLDGIRLRRNYAIVVSRKATLSTAAQSVFDYLRTALASHWPLRPGD